MSTSVIAHMDSPVGPLWVSSSAAGVTAVHMGDPPGQADAPTGDPHGALEALSAYFGGALGALDRVPVDLRGTPFQKRVWEALRRIPAGATTTYGALAAELGSVARANP